MANPENFTADIVSVVIGVIVVAAVAIPIINGMVGTNGKPNAGDYHPDSSCLPCPRRSYDDCLPLHQQEEILIWN